MGASTPRAPRGAGTFEHRRRAEGRAFRPGQTPGQGPGRRGELGGSTNAPAHAGAPCEPGLPEAGATSIHVPDWDQVPIA